VAVLGKLSVQRVFSWNVWWAWEFWMGGRLRVNSSTASDVWMGCRYFIAVMFLLGPSGPSGATIVILATWGGSTSTVGSWGSWRNGSTALVY